MNERVASHSRARRAHSVLGFVVVALCACAWPTQGATWHGLEPLKSRRADVERELGPPASSAPGTLRFKVAGGLVTVTFVTAKFVATKKLGPNYEGTVLEVVLQHEGATDTPDSLGLPKKDDFKREEQGTVVVFRNLKDGVSYTFIDNRLRTTRYAPAAEVLLGAQRGDGK